MVKPPDGKLSTKGDISLNILMCLWLVYQWSIGLGQTHPNPSEDITLPDGVVVPKGKGVDAGVTNSSLLYNEYPYNLGHYPMLCKSVEGCNF